MQNDNLLTPVCTFILFMQLFRKSWIKANIWFSIYVFIFLLKNYSAEYMSFTYSTNIYCVPTMCQDSMLTMVFYPPRWYGINITFKTRHVQKDRLKTPAFQVSRLLPNGMGIHVQETRALLCSTNWFSGLKKINVPFNVSEIYKITYHLTR